MRGGVGLMLATWLLATGMLSVSAQAQQTAIASPAAAATLQELLRKPVVLRGTLGADQIQLRLQPKTDEDGLEGSYFIFGQGGQVLLAGEVEQDDLMMEESHNGKDVSGQWEGSYKNGVLSGTWSTLDGSVSKPFALKAGAP